MALKFCVLCDLLSTLEHVSSQVPPLSPLTRRQRSFQETRNWFRAHRRTIDALDVNSTVALLSCLLPERRTDRVYGLQNAGLSRLLSRALGLPAVRTKDLNAYRSPGHGDLGLCLERALQGGGPPALPVVTIEEIDAALSLVAAGCRFSNPALHKPLDQVATTTTSHTAALANIFRRLLPNEAKWLVRLVLKNYAPVHLDDQMILKSMHFLLPDVLHFQQNFDVAVATLRGPFKPYPSCPDPKSELLLRRLVSSALRPVVGIKVARPEFCKARSIDHCLGMVKDQTWMVERKYDGEYCEMHIDLTLGAEWLKIFSKSAKDSTADRAPLKLVLKKCLGIGTPRCKIKSKCILLGEMVVWCDDQQSILPFHKIRKHVTRSGLSLGTTVDSPPHEYEHLMIIFHDLLVLDDVMMLNRPLQERKAALNGLYRKKQGRAMTAESKVLDFAHRDSKRKLIAHLAASIAARHEGLVLKPCDQPYFSIARDDGHHAVNIKLKKDYIKGLGDEADFAVIGASYHAQDASKAGLGPKQYTHFHLGCLTNKIDVKRFSTRPRYKLVGTVGCDQCIPRPELERANTRAAYYSEPYIDGKEPSGFDLDRPSSAPVRMDVAFREPLVFEVLGSSYDKASDTDFWMLRHPRVLKLHEDRAWQDCVSFAELQEMAKIAIERPADAESQENLLWLDRVERSCKRKIARRLASISPRSGGTGGSRATTVTPERRAMRAISTNLRPSPLTASSPDVVDGCRDGADGRCKIKSGEPIDLPLPTPPVSSHLGPERIAEADFGSDTVQACGTMIRKRSNGAAHDESVKRVRLALHSPEQHVSRPRPMVLPAVTEAVSHRTIEQGVHARISTIASEDTTSKAATELSTPAPGTCAHRAAAIEHDDSNENFYPLASCVLYISTQLKKHIPLARRHGAAVVTDLAHWDRQDDREDEDEYDDGHDSDPKDMVVHESQSYPGLRKAVLVSERWTIREVIELIERLAGFNRGRGMRGRVDILTEKGLRCGRRPCCGSCSSSRCCCYGSGDHRKTGRGPRGGISSALGIESGADVDDDYEADDALGDRCLAYDCDDGRTGSRLGYLQWNDVTRRSELRLHC